MISESIVRMARFPGSPDGCTECGVNYRQTVLSWTKDLILKLPLIFKMWPFIHLIANSIVRFELIASEANDVILASYS
jgi:hypothetical protein